MQKFKRGDKVRIAKNLGPFKQHFKNDCDAIILSSYKDKYGGSGRDEKEYTVLFVDEGYECAWYEDDELTFIEHVGEHGIELVKNKRKKIDAVHSDIKWIVSNWKKIEKNVPAASVATLIKLAGIKDPWGPNGEGVHYFQCAHTVLNYVRSALKTGDLGKVKEKLSEMKILFGDRL